MPSSACKCSGFRREHAGSTPRIRRECTRRAAWNEGLKCILALSDALLHADCSQARRRGFDGVQITEASDGVRPERCANHGAAGSASAADTASAATSVPGKRGCACAVPCRNDPSCPVRMCIRSPQACRPHLPRRASAGKQPGAPSHQRCQHLHLDCRSLTDP